MAHLLPLMTFIEPRSGGSANANEIDSLYKVVLVIGLIIFVAVEGGLIYALVKFRKRKGTIPAQIRGHTRLEVGWTSAAALILVGLAIFTFVKLPAIENPPNSNVNGASGSEVSASEQGGLLYASANRRLPPNGKALDITVIGRQYIWQYVYPGASQSDGLGAPYSYYEMVVPTKTTVSLDIVSDDVVHSWWIPALGGKFQAVPGYNNYTWFKIEKPGVFKGQCAFLCGRGHARMTAEVRAVEPPQFEEWLARQKTLIKEANEKVAKVRTKLSEQEGASAVEAAQTETP